MTNVETGERPTDNPPSGGKNLLARRAAILAAALLGLVVGCGQSQVDPPAAIDAAAAKTALTAALDAWKDGSAADSLREKSPALLVADDDWTAGRKLTGYKISEQSEMGLSQRFQVELQMIGDDGAGTTVEAIYRVATGDMVTISRDDS